MDIGQWEEYCNEKFDLKIREQQIRDQRKRPIIPTGTILKSVREMVVLGQKSLLALDQYARSPEALTWHRSRKKDMVVSDTTVVRVLEGVDREGVVEMPYAVVGELSREGYWDWKLGTGRKLRGVAMVDGSCFGGWYGSVLALAGKSEAVVDMEPYEGRGHELDATRTVLRRANQKLGRGFFDLILADGLYPTREDFRLCREELGSDLLVKTQEETLSVLQEARSLFFPRQGNSCQGIHRCEGLDAERGMRYEVLWAEGFSWEGLEYPMTVAWVRETFLKPASGRPEGGEFWVLTTFPGLLGEELRELAHGRWRIENCVFKRLNALVESKHYANHHGPVQEMLLRLWMLGLTLLGAYLFQRGFSLLRQTWRSMKITWLWIVQQMRLSLVRIARDP